MDLFKLHKQLAPLDDSFDMVNWGGCGVVAAMLANKLRHEFPIMRITSTCVHNDDGLDGIRPQLNNSLDKDEWVDHGVHFGHIWLEVYVDGNWHVLDSTGVTQLQVVSLSKRFSH